MKIRLLLCLVVAFAGAGCVSRKLALRESTDVPATNAALTNATHAVALIISTSAAMAPLKYSEAVNGILISADGYILTVSLGLTNKTPMVYVDDERYGAEIIYNNSKQDFAILKIAALSPLPYLRFSGETDLRQNAYLLGKFRKAREVFMSKGTLNVKPANSGKPVVGWVSSRIGQKRKVDYAIQNGILHSDRFFDGLSGCPMLDENGNVVGMNAGTLVSEERRVTPAVELIGFLPFIQKYGDLQLLQNEADTSDLTRDLNDPQKKIDWVMSGLVQYGSLLGKDVERLEGLRSRIGKEGRERMLAKKNGSADPVPWIWQSFLSEIYSAK